MEGRSLGAPLTWSTSTKILHQNKRVQHDNIHSRVPKHASNTCSHSCNRPTVGKGLGLLQLQTAKVEAGGKYWYRGAAKQQGYERK